MSPDRTRLFGRLSSPNQRHTCRALAGVFQAEIRRYRWSRKLLLLAALLSVSVWTAVTSVQPIYGSNGVRGGTYISLTQPETFDGVYGVFALVDSWYSLLVLLPPVGLLFGYGTIVQARESGRLEIVLSLPCTRRTILLGTVLARMAVFSFVVLLSLAVGWLAIWSRFETVSAWRYLVLSVVTLAYGLVWISIGVAISTSFSTARRAAATVFITVVGFTFNWHEGVVTGLGFHPTGHAINPQQAYFVLVSTPYSDLFPRVHIDSAMGIDRFSVSFFSTDLADITANTPIHFSWPVATVVLVLWIVVPLSYACWRFERMELT
ncbi:ABC transporter permease [Natrinema ejinorense]|uniref:ABC transporter permease n=1 Tax=Natrinema ejinorense TaxID=373386 RepID=A0A2A5QZ31_9EURY|nr:ABC transporter permease subunit [Natrinema ejinorense]PCR92100.1 hypothetical protein CP557_17155 [Natrinema ejinorense]